MKTIDQKLFMTRRDVVVTFADIGYIIFVEGSDSRGEFSNWRGVVTSLSEVFSILEQIDRMEKAKLQ